MSHDLKRSYGGYVSELASWRIQYVDVIKYVCKIYICMYIVAQKGIQTRLETFHV